MTKVLQCVYKSRPFDGLDLFYDKVNIGRICILLKCHLEGKSYRKWAVGLSIHDAEKMDPRGSSGPTPEQNLSILQ